MGPARVRSPCPESRHDRALAGERLLTHFAFIAPPLPGHFNPLQSLAGELVRRGHRVTFVNQADAEALLHQPGIGFAAVGRDTHPPGSLERRTRSMGRLHGPLGMRRMIGDVAAFTDMICREAPRVLREIRADAIISDQMEPAGGLVAEALGLPLISVATALPINREEGVPPPYVGWRYDPSEGGIWRNRGGYRVADWLMRPVGDVIERNARALGLTPRRTTEQCLSERAQVAQCVASIDYPRQELSAAFHYCGPFRDPDAGEGWSFRESDPPLVFCSFGTLQGARGRLFRNVAGACAQLGLRLVIAHGGRLDPKAARSLPGDPIVRDFVPQRAVLRRASLAITHGGFNTVLDALSFGVPMIVLPLAFEQPATAARLERAGVARMISPLRASANRLSREIEILLHEPRYRQAAAEVAADIAASGGVTRAADIVEASLS